jgi:hypothetical protein
MLKFYYQASSLYIELAMNAKIVANHKPWQFIWSKTIASTAPHAVTIS